MRPASFTMVSLSRDGHRGAYEDFVSGLFHANLSRSSMQIFNREAVFFLMIEETPLSYFLNAIVRSLLGRRTSGLLFRAEFALSGTSLRLRLKRTALKLLKRMRLVQTISIVPTPLRPDINMIVDGWMHDFQLWDIGDEEHLLLQGLRAGETVDNGPAQQFFEKIKYQADGRDVVISLGMQTKDKGYEILTDAVADLDAAGWFVVAAGKVATDQKHRSDILSAHDMISEDRFLEDAEMIAAYAAADAVWCLYDPQYDQASGILGRAAQFGIPALVRKGSLSEAFCESENVASVSAVDAPGVPAALLDLPCASQAAEQTLAKRLRAENIERLTAAIWGESKSFDE